ncbi:hypothetical protein ACLKA6_017875 [Drosophila palustris]
MDCLLNMVSGLSVRGDANSLAEALADGISAACNASMASATIWSCIQTDHEEAVQTADAYAPRPTQPNNAHPLSSTAEHPGSLILQDDEIVATNSEEVLITTAKVKAGKAPGPYGIPNGEREIGAGPNNSLPPGNLVATMLASEHGWAAISNMTSNIMKELRRRERSRATSLLAYIRPREGADR